MGELRKRGRVWWIRYYRNGRRHEESARTTKQEEAKRLLRLREGAVAKGEPISAKVGQLRFDEAADALVNEYKANHRRTTDHVDRRIKLALRPWFGGRRMATISTEDVRAYIRARQDAKAANASINRELAALKRMYTLALQAGSLVHRPHIPMLREDNVRTGFFEREQFEAVRRHLPRHLKALVTFAYLTGWRVQSEVLPLTWAQVDRKVGTVRLEPGTTKNREGRLFVYGDLPELTAAIEGQWAEHAGLVKDNKRICPWVFPHLDGKRRGQPIKSFRDSWRRACLEAGVPGRVPHDFRRTAVRNLVRAGVSEKVAMTLTGHRTRSVFDRYDVVSERDLAVAGRRLAAASQLA